MNRSDRVPLYIVIPMIAGFLYFVRWYYNGLDAPVPQKPKPALTSHVDSASLDEAHLSATKTNSIEAVISHACGCGEHQFVLEQKSTCQTGQPLKLELKYTTTNQCKMQCHLSYVLELPKTMNCRPSELVISDGKKEQSLKFD